MRFILALVASAIISTAAPAEVGTRHIVKYVPFAGEPEPLVPERCEFLEVRDGVKLWRGDCISASPYRKFVAPKRKSLKKSRSAKKRPMASPRLGLQHKQEQLRDNTKAKKHGHRSFNSRGSTRPAFISKTVD